jgi:formyl-CoA transferase
MPPGAEPGDAPGGPREGPDFQNLHRNKRSITLNLKDKEGWPVFRAWSNRPTWWWKISVPM